MATLEKHQRYYAKMKHRRRIWREAGLCIECGEPAVEARARCAKHLLEDYRSLRRYRQRRPWLVALYRRQLVQRWADNGQCIRCGLVLDADADAGRVKCQNCREEICSY